MVVVLVGRFVPLPGFRWEIAAASGWAEATETVMAFSVGALGAKPITTGFVGVELGALIVPHWRLLRRGSAAGRRKLVRAAIVLSLLLAVAQALVFASHASELATLAPSLVSPGGFSAPLAVLSLVAWTVVLLGVAGWTSRHGLSSGVPTLVVADLLVDFGKARLTSGWSLAEAAFALGMVCVAVLAFVSPRWPVARQPAWADRSSVLVPPLLAGMLPLSALFAVLALLSSKALDWNAHALGAWLLAHPAWALGPMVVTALLYGKGFYQPRDLVPLRRALGLAPADPEEAHRLRSATWWSLALYLSVSGVIVGVWKTGLYVDVGTPLLVIAFALDAIGVVAFRARYPDAVVVHRSNYVYWTPEIMAALAGKGIVAHAAGLRFRAMGHFFHPHAPIEILVSRADVTRAEEVLAPIRNGLERLPSEAHIESAPASTPFRLAFPFSIPWTVAAAVLLAVCFALAARG